jgi:hypothetical protein
MDADGFGMRKLALCSLMFLLAGCASSTFVRKNYGPNKSGVVSYLNQGADFVINSRREHALDQADKFCGGTGATLISESNEYSSGGTVTNTNANMAGNSFNANSVSYNLGSNHMYIYFNCER